MSQQVSSEALPLRRSAAAPGRRLPLSLVQDTGAGSGPATRVLRTPGEVAALRETWLDVCGDSVDAQPDFFLWSVRDEPHVVRPHVLVLAHGRGAPPTIVAARLVDVRLPCKVGKSAVYAPTVRAICVPRGNVLGRVDAETARRIVEELRISVRNGEADAILFRHLEEGSPLQRALDADASFAERLQHEARRNLRWLIDLGASRDAYLATLSGSTRKGARRTAERLEREYGDRVSIRVYRRPEEVERCLHDVERVASRTYQRRLGVGYLGDDRQRTRMRKLSRHGWFHAAVLYVDGRPAAFELGEHLGDRFNSLAGGYDPAFGELRVGAHLLLETIGSLAEDGVRVFDFGLGDAPYKAKLAHRAVVEGDFVLYAGRFRATAICAARTAVLMLARLLTSSLERLTLLDRIRRSARRAPAAGRTRAAGYSSAACAPRLSRSS